MSSESTESAASSRGVLVRNLLGLGSVLAVGACTIWLAAAGHLDLYINPRYAVFTVVLAAVAVVASVAGLVVLGRGAVHDDGHVHDGHVHDGHGHDGHAHDGKRRRRTRRVLPVVTGTIGALVTVAVVVAMLALPPTTLSARTAAQRAVDAGGSLTAASGSGNVALLGAESVDTADFGVKDWATTIRQTTDTTALVGERVSLTGFVVPSERDGSFTVTRFVISCCAVDAQPVGVGVTTDGTVPDADRWVRVTGALAANPDASSSARLVIRAATVTPVAQPKDPYEY